MCDATCFMICDSSHACAWAVLPAVGISNVYFCKRPVETYCTLLSFCCVGLNHSCWHCSLLMPSGQYQRKDSVCLLVCFGCACVLVCLPRGKWKGCIGMGMKSSGSLPSTKPFRCAWYCKRRVAPQSNKHTRMHTHMCLPPGPLWWGGVH